MKRHALVFALLLSASLPRLALASEDGVRLEMGFLLGQQNYQRSGFSLRPGGPADALGAAAVAEPLRAAPYNGVMAPGLTWSLRGVFSHVRMTAGFDLAFPTFDGADHVADYTIDGQLRTVSPRNIGARNFRFGLGIESPTIRETATFFMDLNGTVNWLSTDLAVAGSAATYGATGFGFSLSGGARVQLRGHFYVFADGEVGLLGPLVYGGRLGVGFNID